MTEAKYNTRQHKMLRRLFAAQIALGRGWCHEPICLKPNRTIPAGTPWSEWDVPHKEDGVTYRAGPAHSVCNRTEGARRGKKKRWRL